MPIKLESAVISFHSRERCMLGMFWQYTGNENAIRQCDSEGTMTASWRLRTLKAFVSSVSAWSSGKTKETRLKTTITSVCLSAAANAITPIINRDWSTMGKQINVKTYRLMWDTVFSLCLLSAVSEKQLRSHSCLLHVETRGQYFPWVRSDKHLQSQCQHQCVKIQAPFHPN